MFMTRISELMLKGLIDNSAGHLLVTISVWQSLAKNEPVFPREFNKTDANKQVIGARKELKKVPFQSAETCFAFQCCQQS